MARSQSQGVRVTDCPSFCTVVVPAVPVIVTCCSRFCTEPCGARHHPVNDQLLTRKC